ncbi:class I SAM-dependent methyltransferase [Blastopirellula marina]|uniref:class I SAM-dependent methyltransferase n=1 Tax=Blastopirellula marina TaxID=124 RepID=UPI001304F6C5|nr:class I SAM-dependent methyltransferase [Blastopirellula marina]
MTGSEQQPELRQGFKVGGAESDLFQGTADYYRRYRRPYPPEVLAYLVDTFKLDGQGRLLDVGCGTGQVFQGLASRFDEVVAIDADAEMVAAARQTVVEQKLEHVHVRQMLGESVTEELGSFRVATFGASFHWMDRLNVANLVYDRLEKGGGLVVLLYTGIHEEKTAWEAVVCRVLEKWLGQQRRAGGGVYKEGERHEAILARSRFGQAEVHDICVEEDWSIDEIVGFLYSTSYASKGVLGAKCEAFEADLRARLRNLSEAGQFRKEVEYTTIWGRK